MGHLLIYVISGKDPKILLLTDLFDPELEIDCSLLSRGHPITGPDRQ